MTGPRGEPRRTAVLGAGALGLTLAYRLALAGDHVTVIEREQMAGGLAAGFLVAERPDGTPIYLEKFYHHLFRADRAAVSLIEELSLGDRLVWPTPLSTILRDGRIHPLDGARALLRFRPLPFVDRVRMGATLAYLKAEKGYQRLEGQTAESWLTAWMGDAAYKVFAEPLLRQKFGEYAGTIAMPWFWSRVHLRSSALGYMLGGFQQLYDTLARRLSQMGGTICLGTSVDSIASRPDGTLDVEAGGRTATFDRVVSTFPAKITNALTRGMPQAFVDRYANSAALGAHCLVLELDRPMTDAYWIAINDPGFPFLAVVEHTNYIPAAEYQHKHLVYAGNYLPMGDPLFAMSADDVLERFLPYLRRIAPEFARDSVTRVHAFSAPFAQPVVTVDFATNIAPHLTPIPNLYMANMFQIYPQDRGQNYSIAMANRIARRLSSA